VVLVVPVAGEELMSDAEHFYSKRLISDRLVYVVDPDPLSCEDLRLLFRLEGFETAVSYGDAALMAELDRRRPDLVLLNLRLGEIDGLDVLRRFKELHTGAPVFAVQDRANVERAVEAMKAGASDVITKPIDSERVVRMVLDVLRRDIRLGVTQSGGRPVEVRGFSKLTPRERQVLELITNGSSNKESSRELGISPRTIEVHRARVMEKLGARNTADLIRIVLTS
jgi:FixJ family two-component response regulator